MTRPALPRTSSAMSGLRFWGMIELPVENASPTRANANSALAHSTISSPSRDTVTARIAQALRTSSAKSRLATASIELGATRSKPSSSA